MEGLLLRAATEADRTVVLDHFQGLNRFEHAITGDRDTSRAGAEASLADVERRVAGTGGHRILAVLGGEVIGLLFLAFPQQPPYVRPEARAHGYVSVLHVREDARGTGIGRALLAEAERLTRARGLDRMLIGVVAGNERAAETYRRAGFAPYSQEMLRELR